MHKLRVPEAEAVIEYAPGQDLLSILTGADIGIQNPCNGKGTCGKCRVRILEGMLRPPGEAERRMLKPGELEAGIRLACLAVPEGDVTLERVAEEKNHRILTQGHVPVFAHCPVVTKRLGYLEEPTLALQTPLEERLCKAFGVSEPGLDLLRRHAGLKGSVTGVFAGERLIALEPGDTRDRCYGVAVDIGTTTVVASLVDLLSGAELAVTSEINPQKRFGLDVLTRITYCMENPETGTADMQREISSALNRMILDLCRTAGVAPEHVYEIAVAANTTMMHFLLGVDAAGIGRAPYAPVFTGAMALAASEAGICAGAPSARLYCLPSVSAYIGADIVAGAYVCRLHQREDRALFIDIGTNGEIVLSDRGRMVSCSCAAGPALEGMNISSGMRAAEGAVEELVIDAPAVSLTVIGDVAPTGLCGSGILAAVRELLRVGLVKPDGAFIKKETLHADDPLHALLRLDGTKRECHLTQEPDPIRITQKDVRQVQLAKGAILSGFYALLKETGIRLEDLDAVLIAGQFGAHLPVASLVGVGLLPPGSESRLSYVGNASKTGAYMALMSGAVRGELETLAGQMDYLELGAREGYERLFGDCLVFPAAISG